MAGTLDKLKQSVARIVFGDTLPTREVTQVIEVEKKGAVGPLKDDKFIWMPLRLMMEQADSVNYPYKESLWVYASIKCIAENIGRLPFRLLSGDEADANVLTSGPLYDVFLNPNPFMTQELLFQATMIYLGLRGECHWYLDRENPSAVPKEIWPLDSARMEPIWYENKDKLVKAIVGWKYRVDGNESITFPIHEIIHFKYFNPYDPVRGMSPLEALRLAVDTSYYADVYNKNFFKNGVSVSGFLTYPPDVDLDDDQYKRLIDQLNERHGGYSKSHKIMIATGGATFTQAKLSQRDMEFIKLKELNMTEIFGAYKVNAVIMGIYKDIQSYEGVKTAHKMFWEECLLPKVSYIEGVLWSTFFSKLSTKAWGKFDLANVEALHDSYQGKIETAEKMVNMGWPLNAVNKRLQLGMPNVAWGDVSWMPYTLIPISGPERPVIPSDVDGDPNNEPPAEEPDKEELDKEDESKKLQWSRFITRQRPVEDLFKSKLSRFIFEQRKTVLSNIYAKSETLLDVPQESERLAKIFYSLYPLSMQAGREMLLEDLGISEVEGVEIELDILNYTKMRGSLVPSFIVSTIVRQLQKALEGKTTVEERALRVREVYNTIGKRVAIIARTESGALINMGRILQMFRQGVTYHRWISSKEGHGRSAHKKLDGKVVKIGKSFLPNETLRWPGDLKASASQVISCLCFTVPEI
jgi:HK97 family phage portal protein